MYEYFSNGAGVAVGDLNGDSLEDVYFTGNMTYNRLYLNKGNMAFEDVTEASGTAGRANTWKTGVTMADVNGDGLLDIYVCYSGDLPFERRIDELYINQGADAGGVPQFEEQAREYGLANPHSSNQAYFFDYDRDGDLDLFLLTHNVERTPQQSSEEIRREMEKDDPVSGNRFYINNGGRFEDVTTEVGIRSSSLTYGLGAGISDFDKDGWLDIYVGNDYSPPDYLYMNNGDGTFSDELGRRVGHTSNASMGIDASDINNDGYPDVVVLDMLAEDNRRQKTLAIPNDKDLFSTEVASGFHHQYMRNTLQLNNGNGAFSEVGQIAGISNTDWSWAPLVADFNNDGRKDLFITNGTLHDITDKDFLEYRTNYVISKRGKLEPPDVAHLMEVLPSSDLNNYLFENRGGLDFVNVAEEWGLARGLKSTGAAYADLDNDGDLDLVTNNINDYASVFENRLADALQDSSYLSVDLKGEGANTFGIGAKVTLWVGGAMQYAEQMPTKGYLSSVSPLLHFGLGHHAEIDLLQVVWPDGSEQTLENIKAGQRITLRQSEADEVGERLPSEVVVFEEVSSPIEFEHQMAGEIDDFRRQPLLENPKSSLGPTLAKADVNGDGLADMYVGGGNGQASQLYLQQENGSFASTAQPAFESDRESHDVAAAFFDYNKDGHLDLYVASGGYSSFAPDDAALQDRLYAGDGQGRFTKEPDVLPEMLTSTGAVAAADINGDSWPDLFVGGYVIPGRYPEPPRSYILINDGQGRFEDRTSEVGPALARIGMVSDAEWHDLNGDDAEELVVAGQWMPILVFENTGGRLSDQTETYFAERYSGLWNTLLIDDLNQDGLPDLVAGNLGLNSQLKASADEPAELYYADFRGDGGIYPVLNFYIQGVSYPYVTFD
ncbi:MAG: VCBS repeat-containing protein, partial [Rhodothermales bacterium]